MNLDRAQADSEYEPGWKDYLFILVVLFLFAYLISKVPGILK